MGRPERLREAVSELPSGEEIARRTQDGWRLVAVEWERETTAEDRPDELSQEIPYGLRISEGGRLEDDPAELEVLKVMLALIIDDEISLVQVAEELNGLGMKTRRGNPWNPVAVFNLLPRLVEQAPRIYSSADWPRKRQLALVRGRA